MIAFMVIVKQVQVHFIIHEHREELDLEFRWLNEPPKEMQKKWRLYERLKRRSDTLHVDDETFAINSEDEEYYK